MHVDRYDEGQILSYDITGVVPAVPGKMTIKVDKFVGGGFAGQVYRVELLELDSPAGPIDGLEIGKKYAIKIMVPPSSGSLMFRNLVYAVGFQGPFQLQVNPKAARAGALWQKLIRKAAAERFGDDRSVVDIYATFVDHDIGSCGEISEWVDGRVWRLEVDDHLDQLKKAMRSGDFDPANSGSPEFLAKRKFMADFVKMLHDMGAYEFARQYYWGTCKSQPNVLKRTDREDDPTAGLTAVDFRAGLALLCFLPMSPGDFPLIFQGLMRGSLVQFDRGSLSKLETFMQSGGETFAGMEDALAELKESEEVYRNSVPDITHNHVRLLTSKKLWSTMFDSAVTGWRVQNTIDDACAAKLRASRFKTIAFLALSLTGSLAKLASAAVFITAFCTGSLNWPIGIAAAAVFLFVPNIAGFLRKLWGRHDYRKHYFCVLTRASYMGRAIDGKDTEKLIRWYRTGRVNNRRAMLLSENTLLFMLNMPLSILPAFLHRLLTDRIFARKKLHYIFVRPIWLYFRADAREHWLRDMLNTGEKSGILNPDDAAEIRGQIKEPFIQKYLKSLAVHVCTLPITQVVALIVALCYVISQDLTIVEGFVEGAWIMALFQVIPISPGSLARGLYVLYLVIRERNFKDYNLAVFMGFFKYIGYLSFPIQMAYRYPALARFMAGHWATGAVHIVPVFGEHGALLEHAAFGWFYNRPLTLRRRMRTRQESRSHLTKRRWHIPLLSAVAVAAFLVVDWICYMYWGTIPHLRYIWAPAIIIPMVTGAAVTLTVGKASLMSRARLSLLCGAIAAIAYGLIHTYAMYATGAFAGETNLTAAICAEGGKGLIWRMFAFGLFAVLGMLLTEAKLPIKEKEPQTA